MKHRSLVRQLRKAKPINTSDCRYNAHSRYLWCAVHPMAKTCDRCSDYREA
ncbi:DUF6464 family protein [Leptolyngbya boryana]|uniref:DUF6464 family protein n=1 Tax=Leptolyngbya boryana TaxID=1184 RepID=UPI001CED371A